MIEIERMLGAIIIILGGIFLILSGIFHINQALTTLHIVTGALTTSLAIFALTGGILLFLNQSFGAYLAIIGGGVTLVGLFIQIGWFIDTPIYLTNSLFYFDPILVVLGGCLDLLLIQKSKN